MGAETPAHLLRRIHIKYASSWGDLREVLSSLHLRESMPPNVDDLPDGLIIDGLGAFFAQRSSANAQATPSPGNPIMQRATMCLALAFAFCAHAADYLESASARAKRKRSSMAASFGDDTAERSNRSVAIVACSTPIPELELAGRWLPTFLRTTPVPGGAPPPGHARFRLTSRRSVVGVEDAAVAYTHHPGQRLELDGLHWGRGPQGWLTPGGKNEQPTQTPARQLGERPG